MIDKSHHYYNKIVRTSENKDIIEFVKKLYLDEKHTIAEIARETNKKYDIHLCSSAISGLMMFNGVEQRGRDVAGRINAVRNTGKKRIKGLW